MQIQLSSFHQSLESVNVVFSLGMRRKKNLIELLYRIESDDENTGLDEFAWEGGEPERKNELWQKTCFELFWAREGMPSYFELNLSSTGEWNLYRFSAYREGMQEWGLQSVPLVRFDSRFRMVQLNAQILCRDFFHDFPPEMQNLNLDFQPAMVLKKKSGGLHYLAANHSLIKPDFHDRSKFLKESLREIGLF